MAKGTRICKVCGKEYEYCKTWLNKDKFRYQDVACSPECGAEYFALIEASRSGKKAAESNNDSNVVEKVTKKSKKKSEEKVIDEEVVEVTSEESEISEDSFKADEAEK